MLLEPTSAYSAPSYFTAHVASLPEALSEDWGCWMNGSCFTCCLQLLHFICCLLPLHPVVVSVVRQEIRGSIGHPPVPLLRFGRNSPPPSVTRDVSMRRAKYWFSKCSEDLPSRVTSSTNYSLKRGSTSGGMREHRSARNVSGKTCRPYLDYKHDCIMRP